MLGVLASMAALAMERRRDVGLMKALGGTVPRIMRLFLAEAGTLGAVGGLLGFLLGVVLARWIGERIFGVVISRALGSFADYHRVDGRRGAGGGVSAAPSGARAPGGNFARRMMAPLVQVEQLEKRFGEVRALDRVSFEVEAGEWIAIMGPSGSGKTTLINILGGLDHPTGGRVVVDGLEIGNLGERELTRYRADKIGFVFQQFHLVPYLTAVENVMLAQYFHSITDEKDAAEALGRVGLADRLEHVPSELSGGEQQRVAIARALINHPKLILADEPTGNLDEANEAVVLKLLARTA